MKKLILFAFLIFPSLANAQLFGRGGTIERLVRRDPTTAVGDSALVEGKSAAFTGKFHTDWTRLGFSLTVISRGTNDSLLVTVQTTPDPDDTLTYPWVSLTNFGRKAAAATTNFSWPTQVAARDTVMVVFPYYRVMEDHSIDAWTAADTSTWSLTIIQSVK